MLRKKIFTSLFILLSLFSCAEFSFLQSIDSSVKDAEIISSSDIAVVTRAESTCGQKQFSSEISELTKQTALATSKKSAAVIFLLFIKQSLQNLSQAVNSKDYEVQKSDDISSNKYIHTVMNLQSVF
ncbi:MAG: hypothetical protein WCQ67_04155 [Treponema sp.]